MSDDWRNKVCTIEGCKKNQHNRKYGWCVTHYNKWYRTGDPLGSKQINTKICAVDCCERLTTSKSADYCTKHAVAYRKYGDPLERKNTNGMSIEDRISHYSHPLDNGCIIWTGSTHIANQKGYRNKEYPRLTVGGKQHQVSRLVWELHYGEIPQGFKIGHDCDETLCINPKHLYVGDKTMAHKRQATGHADTLSGFRGVSYLPSRNRWVAVVKSDQKVVFARRYMDLVEAANAARLARIQHYGLQPEDEKELTLEDRLVTPHNIKKLLPADICYQSEPQRLALAKAQKS